MPPHSLLLTVALKNKLEFAIDTVDTCGDAAIMDTSDEFLSTYSADDVITG
ncbi:hypothetical protein V7O66_06470 [Methanolobus sp. ZRKC3]|uniref:hypothetical protein n=1 Tax=Methanolobus sp. ZRKC3 TaxID=3125786 RepID=UPI0032469DC2